MAAHEGIIATHQTITLAVDEEMTILQLETPANLMARIKEWAIFFKGTSGSAKPVLVRLVEQSDQGANTYQSVSPKKRHGAIPDTLSFQCSGHSITSDGSGSDEPTEVNELARVNVHPHTGYHYIAPFGSEPIVTESQYIGIQALSSTEVEVDAFIVFEE